MVETFIFHLSFFVVWLEMVTVQTRFISKKPIFALLRFTYFAGVMTMAINIDSNHFPSHNVSGFALGLIVCAVSTICMHFHFFMKIEYALLYALAQMCVWTIALVGLFIAVFIEDKRIAILSIFIGV